MKRLAVASLLALALSASPALAVNDPVAPGDDCSASDTAIGHPASGREQSDKASPPFSVNNPGNSTGARGQAQSQALAHCQNARP
jgi:hypothetical protein